MATLCLSQQRFEVRTEFTSDGETRLGWQVPITEDTGAFWFFTDDNLEIVLKVLDGCGINDHYWIYATGLTDVATQLTVTDKTTGESWSRQQDDGDAFPLFSDTEALSCE